jgi:urease beta subunit
MRLFAHNLRRRKSDNRQEQDRHRKLRVESLELRRLLSVVSLTPIKDNTLFGELQGTQGLTSNGQGSIFVGRNAGDSGDRIRRGLVDFDVAGSIPAGSTINSVTLTMWVSRTQVGNQNVELHKVLADWGEGASGQPGSGGDGFPAQAGDATWLHTFYDNQYWATPGGDFSPTASGVQSIGASNASYTWTSTAQMVADVQSWLDNPGTAFGWLLLGNETQRSSKRFESGESTNVARRPTLTIDYTTPAVAPSVSIGDAIITEGNSGTVNAQFAVSLSAASTSTVTVGYTTADGTAAAGTDYQASTGTVTFAPGQTTQTVTIPVVGDALVEGDETFLVNLSNAQNATIADGQAIGTIANDDAATLSINDITLVEGNLGTVNAQFTVSLSAASTSTVTVGYATADGTAAAGSDYQAGTGTVTFAPGQTTQTVTVPVAGDAVVEANETFLVNLSNAQNATIADGQATGTIANDDAATLSINDVTLAEGNAGATNFIFTVTLNAAVDVAVSVGFSTADGTATTVDGDYAAASGVLNFTGTAGETQTVTVAVTGDTTVEPNETFQVNLANLSAGGRNVVLADAQGIGTITNDDTGLPSVTLAPLKDNTLIEDASGLLSNGAGSIFVGQNANGNLVRRGLLEFDIAGSVPAGATITGATLTMYVTQTQVGDQPVELHKVLAEWGEAGSSGQGAGGPAQPGDATWLHTVYDTQFWTTPGGDFSPTASAVQTVGAQGAYYTWNSTPQLVADIQGWLDNPDTNHGWLLRANEALNSAKAFASGEAIDPAQRPQLTIEYIEAVMPQVSIGDVSLAEGDAGTVAAQFTVTLSAPSVNPVTVDFATADGAATAGSDYQAASGTVTFAPGETTKIVSIDVNGDQIVEPDEDFFVNLSNAANATIADGQGLGTITNDDTTVALDNDTVGLYDPTTGTFYLRNSNSPGNADWAFNYGPAGLGWQPIAGDWNGDGIDTVGLYNPATGVFYLKNTNAPGAADVAFQYGAGGLGWQPLAGDWDNDGIDTIGVYIPDTGAVYLRNSNSAGNADVAFAYGPGGLGWQPVVGDWDNDGADTIGIYDPANAVFYLRNSNSYGVSDIGFAYGPPGSGWLPMAGNWDAAGADAIGLYNAAGGAYFLRNSNQSGIADEMFGYGPAGLGWQTLIGKWDNTSGLLRAAAGEVVGAQGLTPLNQADLAPIIAQAVADWASAGVAVELLDSLDFAIADLPGSQLGMATLDTIFLDVDAAGHGWFVDPTPGANEEFAPRTAGRLVAVDPAAVDRIDLLTVVSHEIGHQLGLDDLDDSDGLMNGALGTGRRREPGVHEIDAVLARL